MEDVSRNFQKKSTNNQTKSSIVITKSNSTSKPPRFPNFCHFFFFSKLFDINTSLNTKKTLPTQIQPTESFRSALTSMVHTQKILPQPRIGLPLLNENDVEEIISVCKAFLAYKTQVSSQIEQVFVLFLFFSFLFFSFLFFSFLFFSFLFFSFPFSSLFRFVLFFILNLNPHFFILHNKIQ